MHINTPEHIYRFRMLALAKCIGLYLKSGMQANRITTPANMRLWASHYTGKQYTRSKKGLQNALADLESLC